MIENNEMPEVAEVPLVDWSKAPSLMDLKQDLLDAKPDHDNHVGRVKEWLENLHVTGKAKIQTRKGNSSIVPKLIRKQAEWRYAALTEPFLSTEDLFNVHPVTWEDRKAAQQNQLLLNHQINTKIDKVKFIDEYVRTAVDEGTVIVKVGWKTVEEEVEEMQPIVQFVVDPAFGPTLEEAMQLQETSPSEFATNVPEEIKQALALTQEQGVPVRPVVTGQELVTVNKVIENHPTLEVCDYRNVIIDPSCLGVIEDAKFVIYSFTSCKADLERDGRYKNLDRIQIENNSILGEPDHEPSDGMKTFNFSDEPRKKFVVYEYWGFWDIHGDGVLRPFVAAWVGSTLIRMEESPFPDRQLPFVVEHYLPIRKAIHGEPDGALLEDNQKVIGAVTRGMIDIMAKSANGQTGIRKDMLDTANRRKYENGQDYEFNPQVDPRQGVYMHTYPEIPASAQFMLQLQNMEAESLTGVKSFHQGVSGQSLGDVAVGVRGALDAASKRELGILRRLSNGIIKIGRKFISMNAEFLSDEEVIRVTNEEFVAVRRDDLSGRFDLRLSISTAEEDNHKAERLAFMLQTMGNNMDTEMSKIILSDIARLHKMPELAKKIEMFEPQPDPVQQQIQMLQLQLLEAQVRKEQALALQAESTAMLNQAKVGTEEVKQGNLQSDTDLKNLDFVEQESGVKQERDIQRIGEQARSQAQLKLLERETNREKEQFGLLKEYIKANKAKK